MYVQINITTGPWLVTFSGEITGPGVEKLPSISHRPTWKWTQVAMATADVGRFR
jgi:hypothetical protein